ncbi:MAG: ABC transporter permease [Bacteroidia bacterium]|nr:ABC transporter permease [Bacteroidia bacterium]
MWKNYFKTTIRNLTRNKLLAFINIFGLSVAFACSILLYLNARRELSFDSFFKDKERVYEIYHYARTTAGDRITTNMAFPVVPTIQKEVGGVEQATRYMQGGSLVELDNKKLSAQISLVDEDFFKVFSFDIAYGNKLSPLSSAGDLVLSKFAAKKIFNREDVVGEKLKAEVSGVWNTYVVSAVTEDFPKTSSITYDVLIRIENHPDYEKGKNNWDNWNHFGFVKLAGNVSVDRFEEDLFRVQEKYDPSDTSYMKSRGFLADAKGRYKRLRIMPLMEIHTNDSSHLGNTVSKSTIYTILVISLVILLIATFNFVNLNIARAFTRVKEVGVRKSLGAQTQNVFAQIWGESFLISLFSVLIGLVLVSLSLPHFKRIFNAGLELKQIFSFTSLATVLLGLFFVSLLAGAYPALTIARINTANILRGKVSVKRSGGFRNSLIVTQFTIASVLILCTAIAFKQFEYLLTFPLGFTKENVVSIPVPDGERGKLLLERLRNKLAKDPAILNISGSSINVGIGKDGGVSKWSNGFDYKDKTIFSNWMTVDYDFIKTMGIQILKGRDFSRDFGAETNNVIVTESMAAQFGEKDMLGKSFILDSLRPPVTIVGIIPDIQLYSLHEKIEPMTMDVAMDGPAQIYYLLVRTGEGNPYTTMQKIEAAFKELVPGGEYQGSFLDENTQKLYNKEKKLSELLGIFSIVAIVLSCLGLFALAMLMIQQRVKEIGVRKVLGASVLNIHLLLTKQFLGLVVLSMLIAVPLAWYFMSEWLQRFPYKTSMDWWLFVLSGALSLFIALLTISYHTVRAALSNPVKSLRTE